MNFHTAYRHSFTTGLAIPNSGVYHRSSKITILLGYIMLTASVKKNTSLTADSRPFTIIQKNLGKSFNFPDLNVPFCIK